MRTFSVVVLLGLAGVVAVLNLSGCAAQRSTASVLDVRGLVPIKDTTFPNVRVYEAPEFDRNRYNGLLIDPVTVYEGPNAQFDGISEEDKYRIAAMLTDEFNRVLAKDFRVVKQPRPGTVRLAMTLVGIDRSNAVLSTALRLTPVGIALSGARTVQGSGDPFTGGINIAAVAYDSETGQVLAATQALVGPPALDVSSGITPLRAAELSTTRAAQAFREYLLRVRSQRPGTAPSP